MVSVRAGSGSSAFGKLSSEYLLRCGRTLTADARSFRTEAALLAFAEDEQRRSPSALWIADPGGTALTSEIFAERIRMARDNGLRHLMVAVGPADGWSPTGRAAAALRLSLGSMTLPHELAALVLAEQIYRASTILSGHPYHLGH